MDYIRTAAGSEASDQSFRQVAAPNPFQEQELNGRAVSSKPNWLLKALPFSQLRPDYEPQQTSDVKSLASCALTAISLNFDQFSLDSFGALPPHLIRRIISRVRADRNYDEDMYGEINTHPDETTIWAIQALYLPQEADDHILGLPSAHLLQHMQGHPITLLPTLELQRDLGGLSAPSNFQFLTTISLNVSDGPIDDQNIQGLRWCTHLTGLWMHGCGVSDYGITLLASALELPGMKGLCRLRAWSLVRCKGITDKSMKTFAKFPGLVMLDLRETSCTDVAIDVFNRQSATLFPHPSFQPCTPGLLDLFSTEKNPSEVLSYLCSTLMKTTDYTALHIIPSTVQISPHFTPFPNLPAPPPSYRSARSQPTYHADGVGVIYGQDASSVANPVGELRRAVKNLPLAWQIKDDEEKGIVRKRVGSDWDKEGNVRYVRQSWREEKRSKPKIFDPAKKRRVKKVEIKGDPRLMMVRMLADGWDQMTWGTSVRTATTIQASVNGSASQIRSAKAGNLVNDIFGATRAKPSGPFRPTQSSSPASSPPSESNSAHKPIRPSLNPFRISSTNSQDIKPLKLPSSPVLSEDATFTSSQPKRRFGGTDTENKRRSGMKMFTINAKK